MTSYSLIVAIDEDRGMGRDNQLLCHLPADLKYFKQTTLGKPIIMGRKTYQSIGKALPGRLNIVLSKHLHHLEDATVIGSLDDAIHITKDYPEVMIIGGAQLFEQTLCLATHIYVTVIHARFEADTFFPELDLSLWDCSQKILRLKDEQNQYDLTFYRYDRQPIKC